MPREKLMTVQEVAAYLNCSPSTVRRMAARGAIPHYRLGRLVRFRRAEVDGWLQHRRAGSVPGEERPTRDAAQLSLFDDVRREV